MKALQYWVALVFAAFCVAKPGHAAQPLSPIVIGSISALPQKSMHERYPPRDLGNAVDFLGSLTNTGTVPDAITGMQAIGLGNAEVIRWVRGLQMPSGLPLDLPPNKQIILDEQIVFVRLRGSPPAAPGQSFPVIFHFLHAPAATVMVTVKAE